MSAVFRRPDTMVATATQSRARTPGTSREVHGGMGYGRPKPDAEGERILKYVSRNMTAI